MTSKTLIVIGISAILLIFGIIYLLNTNTFKLNLLVFLVVNRGILAPNCFWWGVSSKLLTDASGVELYRHLKKNSNGIVPIESFGYKLNLVTNVNMIKEILDNSPFIFGVGQLKYNFFKSFMKENVGVSEGKEWVCRRKYNECVLNTDQLPYNTDIISDTISNILNTQSPPKEFKEFEYIAKLITMKLVFGTTEIVDEVFQIFSEANSFNVILYGGQNIDPKIKDVYLNYLKESLRDPKPDSLIEYAVRCNQRSPSKCPLGILDQIPHWIFPTGGLIHTTVPRMLLLLCNHRDTFDKLRLDIINYSIESTYLRQCILETLRLNNPVVTSFRSLLEDFKFKSSEQFKFNKDDQFVILNNPVLREKDFFYDADKFVPERWNEQLEQSYYAIMFNQGPQRCPGKELAIFVIGTFIVSYLGRVGVIERGTDVLQSQKIDIDNIPQMINPCGISFEFK